VTTLLLLDNIFLNMFIKIVGLLHQPATSMEDVCHVIFSSSDFS